MTAPLPTTLANSQSAAIVVIVLLGLAVLICGAVMIQRRIRHTESLRAQAVGAWAHSREYQFDPATDTGFHSRFRGFASLRNSGRRQRASNTVTLSINALGTSFPVRLGDVSYVAQFSDSAMNHYSSYLLLTLPFDNLPSLCARLEDAGDRVAAALGFHDINLEDEEFSRIYHVSSRDKHFAYDLFDQRMMDHMKSLSQRVTLEIADRYLLLTPGIATLSGADTRWSTDQFDERIAFAREFLDRISDRLLARLIEDCSLQTGTVS